MSQERKCFNDPAQVLLTPPVPGRQLLCHAVVTAAYSALAIVVFTVSFTDFLFVNMIDRKSAQKNSSSLGSISSEGR